MVQKIAASKAHEEFAETFNRVAYGGERVVLDEHGKSLVAMIPIDDFAFLEAMEDRDDIAAARAALDESDERVSYEEARRELGF